MRVFKFLRNLPVGANAHSVGVEKSGEVCSLINASELTHQAIPTHAISRIK